MIDGCLKWQTEGLHASQNVKDATDEYLASEDLLAQWIEERCVKEGSRSALTQDLFADWQFWCQGNSYHCDSIKRFSQNLESHGFKRVHTRDGNRFEGISLHWSA